jgi:hypothetical protein
VMRHGDGLHLLLVHQFVAFLHLLALFSSSVLEPYLDLQEEINLSSQFSRGTWYLHVSEPKHYAQHTTHPTHR